MARQSGRPLRKPSPCHPRSIPARSPLSALWWLACSQSSGTGWPALLKAAAKASGALIVQRRPSRPTMSGPAGKSSIQAGACPSLLRAISDARSARSLFMLQAFGDRAPEFNADTCQPGLMCSILTDLERMAQIEAEPCAQHRLSTALTSLNRSKPQSAMSMA